MQLILASQSPRRKELLGLFHIPFAIRVSDIDETVDPEKAPYDEVARVSRLKALAVPRDAGDVVIALSYSGETDELRAIVEYAERNNNTLIAMTGNAASSLARHANVLLNITVQTEDCVLDIVPTSSTTAQLAMGDAIATVLMQMRGFKCANFAQLHPGGYIERRIKMNEGNNN